MTRERQQTWVDEGLDQIPAAWNAVTSSVINGTIEVHSLLGPGLPERQYEDAMEYELVARGLTLDRQRSIRLTYKGRDLSPMVLDLVVNDLIVVELKAVELVHQAHQMQLTSYLRASGLPVGLLINFGGARLKDGLYRRVNPHAPLLTAYRSSLRSSAPSASSAYSADEPRSGDNP